MKRLVRRIKALLVHTRSKDRRPGSGRPADQVRVLADTQGKAMAERMEAGPFRSI